jgi:ABC-type nitrate/sulfonate/bicarbonate transport system ATPase subunit
MPGAAVLEVRIRSKAFPTSRAPARQVLRDVAFSAAAGEIVVLLGPSGVGKSTILRIALGLDAAFDGSLRLPSGRLGVMFQEPRLLPWLTVADNIALVRPPGAPVPDVAALLEDVLLPAVAKLLPSELSLGMARRVSLARSLAVDPDTLVLDEPFASLDIKLAAALGARIVERVRRRGTLVLLSTHDVDQALAMASRILVVANDPGTLETDISVPDRANAVAISQLREDLLTRFRFLGRTAS